MAEKLRGLQARFPLIGEVRDRGLFFALDLVQGEGKVAARDEAFAVVNGMKEDGVLLSMVGRNRSVLKIRPPLVFGKDEADLLVAVLEKNLERVASK